MTLVRLILHRRLMDPGAAISDLSYQGGGGDLMLPISR